jgi:hypothetical protein
MRPPPSTWEAYARAASTSVAALKCRKWVSRKERTVTNALSSG